MKMPRPVFGLGLLGCLSLIACSSTSVDLHVDNDVFGFGRKADRNYTNGMELRVTHAERDAVRPLRWLGEALTLLPMEHDSWAAEPRVTLGWSIKHQMYTPTDLSTQAVVLDDRPYAGILSASVLRAEEANDHQDPQRDYVLGRKLEIGIVGPASRADTLQRWFHKQIDSTYPQGWHHQLHNEPVVALSMWSRNRGLYLEPGRVPLLGWSKSEMDTVSSFGVSGGNLKTEAWAGNQVRLGWNLSRELGAYERQTGFGSLRLTDQPGAPAEETHRFGLHFFAGVEGRAVLHNIFLDGNSWRGSHSVTREPFVADLHGGLAMRLRLFDGWLNLAYRYTHRTPEFREREEAHIFGSFRIWYQ